jgi:type II secretory pathway component PulF
MLFKAGIPIKESLTQSVNIAGNAVVIERLSSAAIAVEKGQNASEGFAESLPVEFAELWKIGEETGKLEEVTKKLADNYAESAEFLFNEISIWLPRLIYFLIVGVMVVMMLYMLATQIGTAYNTPV